jgi:spore coat polysaccharide biosynthesis predicted glycosyltransferase SpsG
MADAIVNCLVTEPRPPALPKPERLFEGPAYAVLDAVYAASRGSCRPSPGRAVSRVLVTLGGVDSEGLCAKAALALQRVTGIERLVFACGKDYAHLAALKDACLGAAWKSEFRLGEPSLLPLYRDTDMAIVAGGLTMHEVCCVGLPAIALCQRVDHQEELAIRFARDGAMVAAGVGREISDDRLVYVLQSVISNPDQRGRLAQRGPQLVDGRGASRVASIALALAEGKDPPREHAI